MRAEGKLQKPDPPSSTSNLPGNTCFCPAHFVIGSKSPSREMHPSFAHSSSKKGEGTTWSCSLWPLMTPWSQIQDPSSTPGIAAFDLPPTAFLLAQRTPASRSRIFICKQNIGNSISLVTGAGKENLGWCNAQTLRSQDIRICLSVSETINKRHWGASMCKALCCCCCC